MTILLPRREILSLTETANLKVLSHNFRFTHDASVKLFNTLKSIKTFKNGASLFKTALFIQQKEFKLRKFKRF